MVELVDGDTGASVIYDNNGNGFPTGESLQPQYKLSSQQTFLISGPDNTFISKQQLNLTVAVSKRPVEQLVDIDTS